MHGLRYLGPIPYFVQTSRRAVTVVPRPTSARRSRVSSGVRVSASIFNLRWGDSERRTVRRTVNTNPLSRLTCGDWRVVIGVWWTPCRGSGRSCSRSSGIPPRTCPGVSYLRVVMGRGFAPILTCHPTRMPSLHCPTPSFTPSVFLFNAVNAPAFRS
jgi:hypothetical protein